MRILTAALVAALVLALVATAPADPESRDIVVCPDPGPRIVTVDGG